MNHRKPWELCDHVAMLLALQRSQSFIITMYRLDKSWKTNQQTHLLHNELPGELPYRCFESNWVTYFIKIFKGGKCCVTAKTNKPEYTSEKLRMQKLHCQY